MTPVPSDRQLAKVGLNKLPVLISAAGDRAAWRFIEFFTANIRNANTRRAYARAVGDFFRWCDTRRIHELVNISPTIVAGYIEQLQQTHAKPSVKQHLAAVRMLFDWLVVGQIMPTNPAHSVRGPKHVIKRGKTPMLTAEETRELLDSIDTETLAGLRDRALIGLLVFSFARIGAALTMKVDDYFPEGKRWKLRLHEKGGKEHVVPVHHTLEEYLDGYLAVAGIRDEKNGPLFRTLTTAPGRPLSFDPMMQPDAWRMIRRRAKAAGIKTKIGCHTFRATGITTYLENGGTLEHAQQIAAHESPRTTKLYDRTTDQVSLDEIERIAI
ncbi:MAG: tyrosine-type recombinase/integrase [Candidatus Binatia bacterium]